MGPCLHWMLGELGFGGCSVVLSTRIMLVDMGMPFYASPEFWQGTSHPTDGELVCIRAATAVETLKERGSVLLDSTKCGKGCGPLFVIAGLPL